jgi:hypothetical protein
MTREHPCWTSGDARHTNSTIRDWSRDIGICPRAQSRPVVAISARYSAGKPHATNKPPLPRNTYAKARHPLRRLMHQGGHRHNDAPDCDEQGGFDPGEHEPDDVPDGWAGLGLVLHLMVRAVAERRSGRDPGRPDRPAPTTSSGRRCLLVAPGMSATQAFTNASLSEHHPVRMGATALGCSLGIGRLGSMTVPQVLGLLIGSAPGLQWNSAPWPSPACSCRDHRTGTAQARRSHLISHYMAPWERCSRPVRARAHRSG